MSSLRRDSTLPAIDKPEPAGRAGSGDARPGDARPGDARLGRRPSHGPRRPLSLGLAACCAVLLASTELAHAQQHYRLQNEQWRAQSPVDPDSPEGQLLAIRRAIADDQPGRAEALASEWIDAYPNHPKLVEAYLLRGDARIAQGDYYKSLFDYEFLIRTYPASEQYMTALEREYEIARRFAGLDGPAVKRKLWGLRIVSAKGEAEEIFIRIQERAPGSPIGEKASIALGDHYFKEAEMGLAAEAYDLFLTNYPRSRFRERAMLRLIQSNLARFKGPNFDPTGLIEAQQRLRSFREQFPAAADRIGADALLVRINESLARKAFEIARWYDRRDETFSAAYLYQRVIHDFPQTAAGNAAKQRLSDFDARWREAAAAAIERTSGSPIPPLDAGREAGSDTAQPRESPRRRRSPERDPSQDQILGGPEVERMEVER